jgi:hypothetical protein
VLDGRVEPKPSNQRLLYGFASFTGSVRPALSSIPTGVVKQANDLSLLEVSYNFIMLTAKVTHEHMLPS